RPPLDDGVGSREQHFDAVKRLVGGFDTLHAWSLRKQIALRLHDSSSDCSRSLELAGRLPTGARRLSAEQSRCQQLNAVSCDAWMDYVPSVLAEELVTTRASRLPSENP